MKILALLLAFSILALAGCGASNLVGGTPAAPSVSLTGNWEIAGTPVSGSTMLPGPIAAFMGS